MARSLAEAPVLRSSRLQLDPNLKNTLWRRQAIWVGSSALLGAVLSGITQLPLDLLIGLSLCVGFVAQAGIRWRKSLLVALGAFFFVSWVGAEDGSSILGRLLAEPGVPPTVFARGVQIVGLGAILGSGAGFIERPLEGRNRGLLDGALGGAGLIGLGSFVATALLGDFAVHSWGIGLWLGVLAFITSLVLLVAGLHSREVLRLPQRKVLERAFSGRFLEPALRASTLDQALAGLAPDADTREGLGEVAAWVVRLQWQRQAMEAELDPVGRMETVERKLRLAEEAQRSQDQFTRERILAAIEHIERLEGHHAELVAEDSRTAALVEYALASLDEARASLLLSRVTPGDASPVPLGEVLGRLRSHAEHQRVQRKTQRELGSVA
jgi:hypothetical protein